MGEKMIRKELLCGDLSRPDWVKNQPRSEDVLWLDKNECTDPQMNFVVMNSLSKVPLNAVFSYPNLDVLYKKISSFSRVLPEEVLITAGSDGAIRACFETCINDGDKVVLTRPTFAMYDIYSKIYGAKTIWLEYQKSSRGPYLEANSIVDVIKRERPKMVCLPNPDSPTGTVFCLEDLEKIIRSAENVGALMLVDEAYYPIYPVSIADWIYKFKNLVVARSFSKAWGAAGLRVGYAIANKELIRLIHKQRPMYEIGNVSAKALEILLDYEEEMRLSVKRLNDGKKYFQDSMSLMGFATYESHGNFLHVKFGKYAEKIHDALSNKVYYRKDFDVQCLEGYSRFSATTIERFKPVVETIRSVLVEFGVIK